MTVNQIFFLNKEGWGRSYSEEKYFVIRQKTIKEASKEMASSAAGVFVSLNYFLEKHCTNVQSLGYLDITIWALYRDTFNPTEQSPAGVEDVRIWCVLTSPAGLHHTSCPSRETLYTLVEVSTSSLKSQLYRGNAPKKVTLNTHIRVIHHGVSIYLQYICKNAHARKTYTVVGRPSPAVCERISRVFS